jgi:Zn-dependent protease with chaperone function
MNEADSIYAGFGWHASLGEEAVPGNLVLGQWTIRFESEAASMELPFDGLQIQLGQGEDEQVYFSHPRYPDWTVCASSRAILEHRLFSQRTQLRAQLRALQERTEGYKRLKVAFLVVLGFAVISVAGFGLMGWIGRSLVNRVPVAFEEGLGAQVFAEIQEDVAVLAAPEVSARLNALITRVMKEQKQTGYRFRTHLLDEPDPNALAMPGGHILVTRGLLEMIDRPEELAGVLAHEIAHVNQRHGLRKLVTAAGPYLAVKLFLGDNRGLLSLIAQGSALLIRQNYSREFEIEADDTAWDYLVAARIDPRGLISFLRKMRAEELRAHALLRRYGAVEVRALSSHPATDERIQRLEARWQRTKLKSGFVKLDKISLEP